VTGTYVDPAAGKQTFEAFVDEWAPSQDWKATHRESWPYVRARLVKHLGPMPLSSIDRLALQRVQQELAKTYATTTTTVTMSYARSIMRAAFAAGRIGRDPTVGLRRPKVRAGEPDGKVRPEDVPTRAEALAILAAAPPPFRAAIALGLAGLRVGEVLGMSADRLDLEHRRVTIDRQLQRAEGQLVLTTPKAEKTRTIVVPGVVAVELRRHLRDHRADGMLFEGQRGAPMLRRDRFYSAGWRPALVGAGLAPDRFVFHALRHFCASILLAEGAPLTAVAGHLGDTVDTVSRTYAHWLRDDREVPAEVLDRVLASAPALLPASAR
jgi:integrase